MKEIVISASSGRSRIVVGHNLPALETFCDGKKPLIVTDTTLAGIYRDRLAGFDVLTVLPGEGSKSLDTAQFLYSEFCKRKLERNSFVVSFGGGVVSDLVGFAAATYLRGLRFGAVASTLLAQVDASIGGKNGVNFAGFKNLVGTIRQAEFCLCDTSLLKSLPKNELHGGFAEVIKHAAIENSALFDLLECTSENALHLDSACIDSIVYESVQVKARIVQADETEQGDRKKLNFGHTLGHAIEAKYHLPHGEAVAIGMILAARISIRRGLFSQSGIDRLRALIKLYHLPVEYPFQISELMEWVERDKKRLGDGIQMVLLDGIGKCRIEKVSFSEIHEALA